MALGAPIARRRRLASSWATVRFGRFPARAWSILLIQTPRRRKLSESPKLYAEAFIASTLDKRFQANSYAKTFLTTK